jgi:hypothetical protein
MLIIVPYIMSKNKAKADHYCTCVSCHITAHLPDLSAASQQVRHIYIDTCINTMIIPIRPPSNTTLQKQCGGSIENVEWVMIELNGELLKPLDEPTSQTSASSLQSDDTARGNRPMELGSVQFDSAVSDFQQ